MGQPGGSTSISNYTLSGAFSVDNRTMAESNGTYTSSTTNQSAIYVTNNGNLTLDNATILTTGNTSSSDASSFYGLNGAVLANNGSTVTNHRREHHDDRVGCEWRHPDGNRDHDQPLRDQYHGIR